MEREDYDVVVVGGSWAGLAAALPLARARRRVLVVDAGRPRNRFAHASHGFPGQDGRAPGAIIDTFRTELLAYPTASFHAGEAIGARREPAGAFAVDVAGWTSVRASRLVLAGGMVDELPDLPGLRERWGVTVLHCPYCHGYEEADRRLGVLAAGEASMHQALLLPDWSAEVTLFIQGTFTPDAAQRARLEARGVRVEERPVVALEGEPPGLGAVRLADGARVALDALFTYSRMVQASPLAGMLGCEMEEGPFGRIVRTDARKETSVPGVYAAGDAARMPSNATLSAADGMTAGMSAHQSLALA